MARFAIDLMNGEDGVWQGMRSWQSMITSYYLKWGGLASLPLIADLALEFTGNGGQWSKVLIFTIVAWVFIAVFGAIVRRYTIYTITDRRVNIRSGFLSYSHHGAQLDRIQGVKYEQSLIGRLLNYGTVRIDTAAPEGTDSSYDMIGVRDPGQRRNQIDSLAHEASTPAQGV